MQSARFIGAVGCATALAVAAGGAQAHIVFDQPQGRAGAYHAAALRVGHGCGTSPTVAVRVTIPAGVDTARPQPKPGWLLEVEREPLARAVQAEGGQAQTERVTAVTWRGRLAADQFDAFGLLLKLPKADGVLVFPVVQTCEAGERRWTETAPAGKPWGSVPNPAPVLRVGGAPAEPASSGPGGEDHRH